MCEPAKGPTMSAPFYRGVENRRFDAEFSHNVCSASLRLGISDRSRTRRRYPPFVPPAHDRAFQLLVHRGAAMIARLPSGELVDPIKLSRLGHAHYRLRARLALGKAVRFSPKPNASSKRARRLHFLVGIKSVVDRELIPAMFIAGVVERASSWRRILVMARRDFRGRGLPCPAGAGR